VAEAGAVLIYVLHDVNALDLNPEQQISDCRERALPQTGKSWSAMACCTSIREAPVPEIPTTR